MRYLLLKGAARERRGGLPPLPVSCYLPLKYERVGVTVCQRDRRDNLKP